ncbi:unnamed protein product [Rangifer tarandus platyrhynchus]|uniref:Uncharacterized protein n=1 Tax=Rangifer tarandus platyrhynchus TaxID=3082113 RepID=A0AC59ZWF3_RANTA
MDYVFYSVHSFLHLRIQSSSLINRFMFFPIPCCAFEKGSIPMNRVVQSSQAWRRFPPSQEVPAWWSDLLKKLLR